MPDPAEPAPTNDIENETALFCPACLYDLRGIPSDQCPECGVELDRDRLARSAIPWVHREGLGIGAFLKTAWLATFKTKLFCLEVARPVSLSDARKFRRKVVGLLTVVVMLVAAAFLLVIEDARDPMAQLWENRPVLMVIAALMPVIPVWLFMTAFTGAHMYWFHPKSLSVQQQNRAVAVSHYACAPLVGLVPAVILFAFGNLLGTIGDEHDVEPMIWVAIGVVLVSVVLAVISLSAYLFVCAHMARFTAHRSGLARLALWLVLPPLWLGLLAMNFLLLPLVCFYIYLVIASF